MRQRKVIRTTLGELIVAVTDEVMPIMRNPSGAYGRGPVTGIGPQRLFFTA